MILRATLNVRKHTEISSINPFNTICVHHHLPIVIGHHVSSTLNRERVIEFDVLSAMNMKCTENVLLNSTFYQR
jgi:hypothetical protein